jgi:hypothetical protein
MIDPMPRQDERLPPTPREAELITEIERLRAALEEIAFMGFDMPATLEMTDDAWRRRRTALMQHCAKQALAPKEPKA